MLFKVVNEMMEQAAKEINFDATPDNTEQLLMNLSIGYGIELNEDAPITTDLMRVIINEIDEWKQETYVNFVEK